MTDLLVRQFIADGFVKIEKAVPSDVAQACAELLWAEIGQDPDDAATWTQPVHWVGDMAQEPFVQAANAGVLQDAFDALVGPGRWVPRSSLGSFPLRFPHPDEPDDAGWHVEGSYQPPGTDGYWVNLRSKGRALLMLIPGPRRAAASRSPAAIHGPAPAVSGHALAADPRRRRLFTGRAGDLAGDQLSCPAERCTDTV
ncbi:MAG: hypothetical protein WAK86_12200 [Pseudonocardiaceae bacterium]